MSILTRAATKFDKAFAALPVNVQRAVALAVYRAAPAMQQYQRDLEPLTRDDEIIDATWSLLIGAGVELAKRGKDAFNPKTIAKLQEAAPHTAEFLAGVATMLSGAIPGLQSRDMPARPRWLTDADVAELPELAPAPPAPPPAGEPAEFEDAGE